jgi:transposase-like protein
LRFFGFCSSQASARQRLFVATSVLKPVFQVLCSLRTAPHFTGATIDFLLSAKRDAAVAERFLAKALGREKHPVPRVTNTDKHAAYDPPAIAGLQAAGYLSGRWNRCLAKPKNQNARSSH